MFIEFEYHYCGYRYSSALDFEDDVVKRFHEVTDPQGRQYYMPRSPYLDITEAEFRLFVDELVQKTKSQK